MTVRECYGQMGADYENVFGRLGSEQIVQHFLMKFLNDTSFRDLEEKLKTKDVEQAFHAAHSLKGVCLNLGFDNLFAVSSELTEKLRAGELDGTEALFEKVKEQYDITVSAIRQLEAS